MSEQSAVRRRNRTRLPTLLAGLSRVGVQRVLAVGDFVVILLAFFIGHLVALGWVDPLVSGTRGLIPFNYIPLSIILAGVWCAMLWAIDAYREGILGSGVEEYQRITQATFAVFGATAIASYLLQLQVSRGYFIAVLPLGWVGLMLWRWCARKALVALRQHGRLMKRTLIIGASLSAADTAAEIIRRPNLGLQVVGLWLTDADGSGTATVADVPVLNDTRSSHSTRDIRSLIDRSGIDTVVLAASAGLSSRRIREFSWTLDPDKTSVIVAPSLIDVAGPRLHARPVDGLSLIEVDLPRLQGAKRLAKRVFDIVASSVLIVVCLPIWVIVPIAIAIDDRGPAFFHHTRVGQDGREFQILKFRSMRLNADAELARLLKEQGSNDTPLFKVKDDPRITKLGAFLRASSIDELPQLFNVLAGSMSMVGPRPQVPAEVALYDDAARRRLLVKPGITGQWQVSGRSSLSWEDAVRLDLSYVENWSMTRDMQILFRTVKVVFRRDGAV